MEDEIRGAAQPKSDALFDYLLKRGAIPGDHGSSITASSSVDADRRDVLAACLWRNGYVQGKINRSLSP